MSAVAKAPEPVLTVPERVAIDITHKIAEAQVILDERKRRLAEEEKKGNPDLVPWLTDQIGVWAAHVRALGYAKAGILAELGPKAPVAAAPANAQTRR